MEAALGDDRLGRVEQLLAPRRGLHACDRAHPSICYVPVTYGYRTHHDATSTSRSSAAASPASAWRSASSRRASSDFVVLERADDVGGTWQVNTYPGCACDVPSHLYSFSFAPNPDWTQTYSRQPEIRAYLRRVRRRVRRPPARPAEHRGRAATLGRATAGSSRPRRARSARASLIAGMGPLTEPQDPRHPRARATSRARSSTPPAGTTTTTSPASASPSIGTGASAIQFVPAIQPRGRAAARLPAHAAVGHAAPQPPDPRAGSGASTARFPPLQQLVRGGIYAGRELLVLGFVKHPRLMKVAERIARRHMRSQIADPELLREGHARLHDRLQADPALEPAGTRRSASPTSSWSPTASRRSRANSIVDRRRRRARGRRDHLRHRLPGHRHAGRRTGSAAAAASCSTTSGRAARARTSARRSPASRTCSCCSARTPGSGTARWST